MDTKKTQIEALRQKVAEKNQRIAELKKELAQRKYDHWLAQMRDWADQGAELNAIPRPDDDMYSLIEMTPEERAARDAWINEMIESGKKWGVL